MLRVALLLTAGLAASVLAAPLSGGAEREGRPAAARPAGTLVFLERGNRLLSIDLASGQRKRLRVQSVASCAPELFVTGGHVILSAVRKQQTVVLSVPVTLDERPRLLGAAHAFVRSATEGRVWLAGTDCDRRRMTGVREVTVDGKVTFESHRRVPGIWLSGAVRRGLVVNDHGTHLWNPRTGATGKRIALAGVIATRGDLMVGCVPRSRCRALSIVDAGKARTAKAAVPPPAQLDPGAKFSPDGSLVATPTSVQRRWRVALIDTPTGTTRVIPGSSTGEVYPMPTWTSSGWLVFRGRDDRLMAYRPGEPRAVELPLRWPRRAFTYVGG